MKKYAITYGMKIVDTANSREEAQQMVKTYREITNDKMTKQLQAKLKNMYIVSGTTVENKIGDTIIVATSIDELAEKCEEFGLCL